MNDDDAFTLALDDPRQAGVFFVTGDDLDALAASALDADLLLRRIDLRDCDGKDALLARLQDALAMPPSGHNWDALSDRLRDLSWLPAPGYALLLFNPKRSEDDVDGKTWRYVGSVRTGEDNSAACDEGNVMPCTDSDGELAFVADGNGLPRLTVSFKGTTIDAPGRTRALGAGDAVHYTFDRTAQQYVTP